MSTTYDTGRKPSVQRQTVFGKKVGTNSVGRTLLDDTFWHTAWDTYLRTNAIGQIAWDKYYGTHTLRHPTWNKHQVTISFIWGVWQTPRLGVCPTLTNFYAHTHTHQDKHTPTHELKASELFTCSFENTHTCCDTTILL